MPCLPGISQPVLREMPGNNPSRNARAVVFNSLRRNSGAMRTFSARSSFSKLNNEPDHAAAPLASALQNHSGKGIRDDPNVQP